MLNAISTMSKMTSHCAGTVQMTEESCLVSTIPLPFFRSVSTVAVAGENGNAGNVFPYNI